MSAKTKLRFKSMGRFFICIVGVLLVYMITTLFVQRSEYAKRSEELKTLQEQVDKSELQKEELQHVLEYSKTDEYIESVARDRLGWVKPGEKRYVEKED